MLGEVVDQAGAGELTLEYGFAMGVVSDQMKRAFADVQTEECDIGHDDLPSRKETAQQA